MTDELFLPIPEIADDGTPDWWDELIELFAQQEDTGSFENFLSINFNAEPVKLPHRFKHVGIRFKNKTDMITFMLRYSR